MHRKVKATFLSAFIPALLAMGFSAHAQSSDEAKRLLVVSLQDRKLALLEDGRAKKVYVVAVGKRSTPSPTGTFKIISRVNNPTYSHAGKVVAPGRGNPVGTRWMGLSVKGYGIHGTNVPKSIGQAASHGCIRMAKHDVEELVDLVETGDEVRIITAADPETAEIFGSATGTSAATVVQTAAEEAALTTTNTMPPATAAVPLEQ